MNLTGIIYGCQEHQTESTPIWQERKDQFTAWEKINVIIIGKEKITVDEHKIT